jgi:hypothetical protein
MQLAQIYALAAQLELPASFIGYMDSDSYLNIDRCEGSSMGTPEPAHNEARQFIENERRRGLTGGVLAKIGAEIIITDVDGFEIADA